MKFKDSEGNDVDTDKFDDLKAMAYEELAKFHNALKPFNASLVAAVKYGPNNVVGSMFLEKGADFSDLIQFVSDRLEETTDGKYGLRIVSLNPDDEDDDLEDEEDYV